MRQIVIILSVLLALSLHCQRNFSTLEIPTSPEEEKDVDIFVPYDNAPEPVGGFKAIQDSLIYPQEALRKRIEGRVLLNLHIDKNGEINDIEILKSLGYECDEAAIRAVKSIKWTPAKQCDKGVAVWMVVPVVFKLPEE